MSTTRPGRLQETIERLLPNGLGARGNEERDPIQYPTRPLHVLLACSGSVASVKIPLIVAELLTVSSRACCFSFRHRTTSHPLSLSSPRVEQYDRVQVQVVSTKSALHFFDKEKLEQDHQGQVKVWTDAEEWAVSLSVSFSVSAQARIRSSLVLAGVVKDWRPYSTHRGESAQGTVICETGTEAFNRPSVAKLRRWADLVLVAPCSANTLAKLNHGLCDNILVSAKCVRPSSAFSDH